MSSLIITGKIHFETRRKGRKQIAAGPLPSARPARLPRITRLMALAIHCDQLLRDDVVTDQAELARLGHITRARMTQILNLLHLAPQIQETLLFLPRVEQGRDPITERDLRTIAAITDWQEQVREFERLQH